MYGIRFQVRQPMDMYEKINTEVENLTSKDEDQSQRWERDCLLHLAEATNDGFDVTEVWTSEESAQRWHQDVLREAFATASFSEDDATITHFEPHRLEVHNRESENA